MSAQYDRAKEELTAGTRYEEYRPLVPFLGMMILGILADRFFWSPQEFETSISGTAWGWFVLHVLCLTAAFVCLRQKRALRKNRRWETECMDGVGGASSQNDGVSGTYFRKADVLGMAFAKSGEEDRVLGSLRERETVSFSCAGLIRFFRGLKERMVPLFLLLSFSAVGGLFHHLYWNFYPETEIGLNAGDPFSLECVQGKIVRPPEFAFPSRTASFLGNENEMTTQLCLKVLKRKSGTKWVPATGNLLVRVMGRMEDAHVGDVFQMSGRMSHFSETMNPRAFSARTFYRQQRILAVLRVPSEKNPQLVSRPRIWGVFRLVEWLRDSASVQLERFLTPETRPMAEALILGCREEVSVEDLDEMLETGTIHIMAISGLHVGLLAGGLFLLARIIGTGRTLTVLLTLAGVWLYVLVSGARPPALRAGILVAISTSAYWLARPQSHLNSLAAAGLFVLVLNPTSLFSTGTQLSFLAVGVLLFSPVLRDLPQLRKPEGSCEDEDSAAEDETEEKRAEESGRETEKWKTGTGKRKLRHFPRLAFEKREPDVNELHLSWEYLFAANADHRAIFRRMIRRFLTHAMNLLLASLQMTLVLMPLVVGSFHVAAFIGILLNILLWLPLMAAMVGGAGVVLFGTLPMAGPFFGWICSTGLSVMDTLIHCGAQIPGHCLWMRGTPTFWNFLLYSVLIVWAVFPAVRLRNRKQHAVFWTLMLLLLFPFWLNGNGKRGELRCSAISVSHGLSILIQLPDGRNFLYDAGQFAPAEYPTRTISAFLWNAGVHSLDAIFISHPDMDHYNAVPGLLRRFRTGEIFVSPQCLETLRRTSHSVQSRPQNTEMKTASADMLRKTEKERREETAVSAPDSLDPVPVSWRERQAQAEKETAEMLRRLNHAIKTHNIPVRTLKAGDRIPLAEDCVLTVLHPAETFARENPELTNANSLVLLLEYQGVRILLTGDLAPPGLGAFLAQTPIPCDVVFAPHHGGKTCATPEFGAWCMPKHFVICDSYGNQQKRTREIFEELGAKVYHTGRGGAVFFSVQNGKLEVVDREKWKEWDKWN